MTLCGGILVTLWLLALTVTDLREHRLPNALTLPGAAVILTVAAAEAAIGLAILVVLFRNLRTIHVDDLDSLQG